jgi:hypothetical protein
MKNKKVNNHKEIFPILYNYNARQEVNTLNYCFKIIGK